MRLNKLDVEKKMQIYPFSENIVSLFNLSQTSPGFYVPPV